MSDKKGGSTAAPPAEKDFFLDKGAAKIDEEERKTKKQKDYMADVTAAIPTILASVPASPTSAELNSALVELLAWEKKARLASDGDSTKLLAETILDLCVDKNDWPALGDHITLLTKRRAQLLKVIKAVVEKGMTLISRAPSPAAQKDLITVLRAATDGKLFLEMERADLTLRLARMAEAEGRVAEAADILQEVAVETIGSMDLRQKADYLLEQLRLCLDKKDFLRAELVANKIKTKHFTDASWAPVKLAYFKLMVRYYMHSNDYLSVARAYKALYDTHSKAAAEAAAGAKKGGSDDGEEEEEAPASKGKTMGDTDAAAVAIVSADADDDDGGPTSSLPSVADAYSALSNVIVFAALAPFEYDARELVTRIVNTEAKRVSRLPQFKAVADALLGKDLLPWPLAPASPAAAAAITAAVAGAGAAGGASVADAWKAHPAFSAVLQDEGKTAAERWEVLHSRVVEHNIRVLSVVYTRVPIQRLARLLALDVAATEKAICDLVGAKQLQAKIDRPKGVVEFKVKEEASAVLNKWGRDITELLQLLETTSHLIQKENMVHAMKKLTPTAN